MPKSVLPILLLSGALLTTPCSSQTLTEDFSDPLIDWISDWLYLNSNIQNYYVASGNCDDNNRGNNPCGLWIADTRPCGSGTGGGSTINFTPSFAAQIQDISFEVAAYGTFTTEIFDVSGGVLFSQTFSDPDRCGGTLVSASSTNGVGGFSITGGSVEGNCSVDNFTLVLGAIEIRQVDTVPTMVAPGQTGIAVTMDAENTGMNTVDVTAHGLTFEDSGMSDVSTEYTVTPDPGNPTTIAAGVTATFNFSVDVATSATEDTITLDGTIETMDTVSGATAMDSTSDVTDTWDVIGARPEARIIDAVPAVVFQGQTGNRVNLDIENVGLTPWAPATFTFSFTGTADRSSEYSVFADPANPIEVTPGATETFGFDVDVDLMATAEIITIDLAIAAGVDTITLRSQDEMGADVVDTWDVQACAAPLCGDCDLNLSITILDALKAAQVAAGLIPVMSLSLQEFEQCDVDNSGTIAILDALQLAQEAAGLPVALVCC